MSHRRRSTHTGRSTEGNSGGIRDIGLFVENYNSLLDKLYPMFAVWDTILYVMRWESYLVTLAVILVLSILLYFPSVLFSLLTLAAILFMCLGRYHGQTKAAIALRLSPTIEYLDPDQHTLRKQYSEQGHMHKSRLEFRQILSNVERIMLNAGKLVDYLYNVYLWKSPEVSLCVTVLLCILLVLLCTVDLHTVGAAIPIIVLCSNKYFFLRSIDLWKQLVTRLKQRLDRSRHKTRKKTQTSSAGRREDVDREEEDEEEEEEGEREGRMVDDSEDDDLPVDQDSNNEAGHSDASLTPELRHRTGGGLVDQTSSSSAVAVGGEGGGTATASESENWVSASGLTRRDGKFIQQELCNNCQTSFFLKRKHNCNVCGQTFCGSCTVKVKRAVLGATSPTALETSVRVCLNCKAMLDECIANKE